jgi:dethiobiotin synthetase
VTARTPHGVLLVSGTGTGVGKTVVTAAVAALTAARGDRVAVLKPAQTGVAADEPGDLAEVGRLTGLGDADERVTLAELARYPLALAPAAAARLGGLPPLDLAACVAAVVTLAGDRDLVLVEGAGGLLVPYRDQPRWTIADLAAALGAPVLVVADPGLGTLNHTALTLEALSRRQLTCAGVVLGAWPAEPDLACRANVADLEALGGPLAGAMAAGSSGLARADFLASAAAGLGPGLGGTFDAAHFRRAHAHHPEE